MKNVNKFKVILCLVIITVLSITTINFKCMAASVNFNDSDTIFSSKYSNTIKYVNEFIKNEQQNAEGCSWTSSTKIGEVISTYNLDGNINGFIINLKNGNKDSGYIVMDSSTKSPFISEFAYDHKYYLQQNQKFNALKNKKIINLGNYKYLYFDNKTIKDAYTNNIIPTNKISKIKNEYNNYNDSKVTVDTLKRGNLYKQSANSIQLATVNTFGMPELFHPTVYVPHTMDQFRNEPGIVSKYGWCGPTAIVNFLDIWQNRLGVSGLLKNNNVYSTFDTIESYIGYPYNTTPKQEYDGLFKYAENMGKTPAGGSIVYSVYWNWLKANITNKNIPLMSIKTRSLDPTSADPNGNHAIIALGWEENSSGNYVRVINEWDASINVYYNFNNGNYINAAYYVRW